MKKKMAQIALSDNTLATCTRSPKKSPVPCRRTAPWQRIKTVQAFTPLDVCVLPNLKPGYQMNKWACTPGGPVAQQK